MIQISAVFGNRLCCFVASTLHSVVSLPYRGFFGTSVSNKPGSSTDSLTHLAGPSVIGTGIIDRGTVIIVQTYPFGFDYL